MKYRCYFFSPRKDCEFELFAEGFEENQRFDGSKLGQELQCTLVRIN